MQQHRAGTHCLAPCTPPPTDSDARHSAVSAAQVDRDEQSRVIPLLHILRRMDHDHRGGQERRTPQRSISIAERHNTGTNSAEVSSLLCVAAHVLRMDGLYCIRENWCSAQSSILVIPGEACKQLQHAFSLTRSTTLEVSESSNFLCMPVFSTSHPNNIHSLTNTHRTEQSVCQHH